MPSGHDPDTRSRRPCPTPLFDDDFIDRAKMRMKADGYTDRQIAEARFVVRE
jgi:hypothetical protein